MEQAETGEAELLAALIGQEAQHRARNLISLAIALANQSLHAVRHHPDVEQYIDRLRSLDAVARIGCEVRGDFCGLGPVVEQVVSRLDDPANPRIARAGPEITLVSRWAHLVAIVLHELAANALRHGALSTNNGRVELRWAVEKISNDVGDTLHLAWRELDGPLPIARPRQGFGSRLLQQLVERNKRCRVSLRLPPTGLVYTLDIDLMPTELRW